ncbi:molybdopterin converting factor small subunit [Crossiella equi]|uniref:Molybdopterin synthase sulfur carrier subunit n=1 Tax=Crossiella equi TaxID=130796 RepID=A0ABS5AEL3_9PSEU|nr:MoaD/ThiS family protein [Crossiella equi]MBP2475031.1 molybdopterin converting factor small subunit [Crossiella equi]
MASVTVRYFAGARAAAGVADESVELDGVSTVDDVLARVLGARPARLAKVLPACSFLLNGVAVRDRTTVVPDAAELDVLPPFAGG